MFHQTCRIVGVVIAFVGLMLLLWPVGIPVLTYLVAEFHGLTSHGQATLLLCWVAFVMALKITRRRLPAPRWQSLPMTARLARAQSTAERDAAPWLFREPAPAVDRARHEAAHIVAGRAMGGILHLADITATEGRGGQCIMHWPTSMPVTESSWGMAVLAVAANQMDIGHGIHDQGSLVDLQTAHTAAMIIISTGLAPRGHDGPLTLEALLAGARLRADQILAERTDQVEQIADMLLSKHHTGNILTEADLSRHPTA